MSSVDADNKNKLIQKITNNLDIWRSILYSIVLGDVVINNFEFLGEFSFRNCNYTILILASVLIVGEAINRFLYRDLTVKRIIDKPLKGYSKELWFIFVVLGFEITSLFGLSFGIKGLNGLDNWKYIVVYIFCNSLLNLYEARAIYLKTKKIHTKLNVIKAFGRIFKGQTEFFFLENDKDFSSKKYSDSKVKAYFSEQYIAYNTLFFGVWLGMLLIFFDFWKSISYPQVILFFSAVIICTLVYLFDLWVNVRIWILNVLLLVAFLLFFVGLCGYAGSRNIFIVYCLVHYAIVSLFYLRNYIEVFFKFIPNLSIRS